MAVDSVDGKTSEKDGKKKKNFGHFPEAYKSNWDIYLGKFVCVHSNGDTVIGVLDEINNQEGYVDFKPSVVGLPDETLIEETGLPTRITSPIKIMRKLPGTVEDYVQLYNKHQKNKKANKKENK